MHAVVIGHVVHCLTPTFEGASQGCPRMDAATAPLRAEALKTWVLSMIDGIVEIELGSKVPLAVICVQPPDVIHLKGEECLVGGHVRRMIRLGGEEFSGPQASWSESVSGTCRWHKSAWETRATPVRFIPRIFPSRICARVEHHVFNVQPCSSSSRH